MSYKLKLLRDGDRILEWRDWYDYPTLKEAVREGERLLGYDAFMFKVYNNNTKSLVWESEKPRGLRTYA